MAVTISWKPVSNADKIRVYQSTSKFTYSDIPGSTTIKMVELPGTALSQDVAIPRNTINYFVVSGVDVDGLELFGEIFSMGNFPNTGPGPTTISRGTWEFGLFGEVKDTDFLTNAEVGAGLLKAGKNDGWTKGAKVSAWLKVIVNGKILFIPNQVVFTMDYQGSRTGLLANGGLYLETGFPKAPIISKNNYDYVYRLPLGSKTVPPGVMSSPNWFDDDHAKSEMGMINALSLAAGHQSSLTPNTTGGFNVFDVFSDAVLSAPNGIMMAHIAGKAADDQSWTMYVLVPNVGGAPSFAGKNWFFNSYVSYGTVDVMPILELAF